MTAQIQPQAKAIQFTEKCGVSYDQIQGNVILCVLRYLLERTCAMAIFNAPDGIVSHEMVLLQALHIHPVTHC